MLSVKIYVFAHIPDYHNQDDLSQLLRTRAFSGIPPKEQKHQSSDIREGILEGLRTSSFLKIEYSGSLLKYYF